MRKEYDFSKGVRGKYAKKYQTGTNIVLLDPDVAKVFKTPRSVNQALRSLTEIIKAQKKKHNAGMQISKSLKEDLIFLPNF